MTTKRNFTSHRHFISSAMLCVTAWVYFGGIVMADASTVTPDTRAAETTAIEALVSAEMDAWNRGDPKAFAERFAEDGTFTNVIGAQYYGRHSFEERHAAILSTIYKGSSLKLSIGRLHFIRADVAIVDVDGELRAITKLPPGVQVGTDGVGRSKLLMVLEKTAGKWWIAAYHNVSVVPMPPKP